MTDWAELKVADLKEELKSRGIPLTGLKLKQQFIDKLEELDAESSDKVTRAHGNDDHESADSTERDVTEDKDSSATPANVGTTPERMAMLPDDLPPELKQEESEAKDEATPPPVEAETAMDEKMAEKDDPFVLQESREEARRDQNGYSQPETMAKNDGDTQKSDNQPDVEFPQLIEPKLIDRSSHEGQMSAQEDVLEDLDDQRKRKRRSSTPPPDSTNVAVKRAKSSDGAPVMTKQESSALEKMQEATDTAQAIRSADGLGNDVDMLPAEPSQAEIAVSKDMSKQLESREQSLSPRPRKLSRSESRSSSRSHSERDVSPALHPATSSLYIRNFKRPLHLPTLRNHISTLARPFAEDPIKHFYLDSIRTHAFVSFANMSAAAQVRNAMHGTRFPDEPLREPLWIDFVPDENVQAWIDIESGSAGGGFGGGRSASKKYEVVFNQDDTGRVQAQLQEASGIHPSHPQRPGFQQSQQNRISISQDPMASAAVASCIHPSRASLVPQSLIPATRHPQQPPSKPMARSDQGSGFRALDELFRSTTAKPKLYFKLVPQSIIDDRIDMIRDLRVGHDQMGRSGDEGMKRYSFEKGPSSRGGQEEWVDKGPEFGFGRRGQERLTGYGSSYGSGGGGGRGGGGRGRGGYRGGRRGGDSWRGR